MDEPPKEEQQINRSFDLKGMNIPIERLLPTKKLPPHVLKSSKYKQTEVSIREIGIIEPPVVFRQKDASGQYLLLDGHMRVQILENLGHTEVFCLMSTDDETHTYNRMINRLNPMQEHYMILRAIERGVSEESLARNLGLDIDRIKEKRNLLKGICAEVVEMFKSRDVPASTFQVLKKMKPVRQIQTAELMVGANNYSSTYAKAMLSLTPADKLEVVPNAKKEERLSPEQIAGMETELAHLETEYKVAEQSLGDDVLTLVVYRGYISRLVGNHEVLDYLNQRHPEILQEFQRIIKVSVTDGQQI
ncbi:MAG: ParB N-terminal domain-containing protein [Magnetococcales bacterium]|nr:ParB N-terminal domain-containing protein [Magnetococcales bacterium]